ncbi:MAG: bifunctional SulP family inorganic anion transporter/carbonic anhydrase [Flavobacteriia bacterium]|nr:bifunctional SulP family inorganic anion transporter/carbonic anhydrase [Flavobacteriia bacterium]
MFSKLKFDFPASIVVFLVALPLCLGVALASNAPILSGILSGVIGGVVVGVLSRSQVSVSGPAAGLTTVVLVAINQLGSFDVFLVSVIIAGVIQILAGYLKAGIIANYIPSNVIKGLLASIGIILILKQIPHAFGYDDVPEEDFAFLQSDNENTFSELFNILNYFSYGAIVISMISIFMLIYWEKITIKWLKKIPASLFVVIFGIILNSIFYHFIPFLYIHQEHLVNMPKIESFESILSFPNFMAISNKDVWIIGIEIAAIATLETLLNLEAVENIDPYKRKASPNRELIAQGYGNIVSGLIGGIPITSVIVRSSVNINAGGQTKMVSILHGLFLLLSILFLGSVLNLIPLASLAAILIITGYKLAKITLFIEKFKKGWNQFIPFIVTVISILFTDLLIGILIGLIVSILFLLKSNYKNPFKIKREKLNVKETITIELPNQVSFLNKASIKNILWGIPKNSNVILEAKHSDYIDNDILELIEDFRSTIAKERNIHLNIYGLQKNFHIADQIEFVNIIDKDEQQKLSPKDVLEILMNGNKRFADGILTEKYYGQQINATSDKQNPIAVIVSCIDSRTSPEIIFDLGLGDIISIRIAGNIINREIVESIEFSCQKIGTKLIVILGHSNCGAVTYAVNSREDGQYSSMTSKIEKSIIACNCSKERMDNNPNILDKVIVANTNNSITEVLLASDFLKEEIKYQRIKIVSGFYDTKNGRVTFDEF